MNDSTMTGSGSASDANGSPASRGRATSRPVLADVKELGGQLADAARNRANALYEEQRDRTATEIAALGQSLERSANSLEGTVGEAIAPHAVNAARRVEDFADTLRDKSMRDLGGDVEAFARQWPMAFIAAAIGAGFLAGRFLLSSNGPAEPLSREAATDDQTSMKSPTRSAGKSLEKSLDDDEKPARTQRPASPRKGDAEPAGAAATSRAGGK